MAVETIAEAKSEPAVVPEPAKGNSKSHHDAAKSPAPHQPKERLSTTKVEGRIMSLDELLKRKRPVRYFIMKCADKTNLATALAKHIWSTQVRNEKMLMDAYDANEVVLIFSVNQSGYYQGYARMVSGIGGSSENVWEQGKFGNLFSIEWMAIKEVNFQKCAHLRNPLNEDKPVKISRDGQEVPGDIAYQLCKIIDGGTAYDISCTNLSKRVDQPASQSTATTSYANTPSRGARDSRYSGRATTGFEDSRDRSYNDSYSTGSSYSRSAYLADYPPPRSHSYESPNRYPTDRSPPRYPSSYAGASSASSGGTYYYDRGYHSSERSNQQQAYYRGPSLEVRNGSKYLPPPLGSSGDARRGEPYPSPRSMRRDDRQGPHY